jgi:hypothetical protein
MSGHLVLDSKKRPPRCGAALVTPNLRDEVIVHLTGFYATGRQG